MHCTYYTSPSFQELSQCNNVHTGPPIKLLLIGTFDYQHDTLLSPRIGGYASHALHLVASPIFTLTECGTIGRTST